MAFFFFCPVLCSPVKSHNRCSVISLYKKAEMKERNFVKSETWIKAQSMVRINSSYFLHICYDMIPSCTDYRCNLPISLCFGVGLVCMGKQQASIHIWITDFLKNNKSLFPEKKGSLIFFFFPLNLPKMLDRERKHLWFYQWVYLLYLCKTE